MIVAGLALLCALWAAALGVGCGRTTASARLWLSIMGILMGIGIVMLSGRTVGLLWLFVGVMALMTLDLAASGGMARLVWRPRLVPRLLWATPVALAWLIVLLWEPPANMPLVPKALEIAQVVGIAFAHHTWAVVGLALLGLLACITCSPTGEN